MTIEDAAQAAADRHDTEVGFVELPYDRDLYVRAFRQGAQWQQTQEIALLASAMKKVLPPDLLAEVLAHLDPLTPFLKALEDARVEPLITSPSPSAGSTAATDQG